VTAGAGSGTPLGDAGSVLVSTGWLAARLDDPGVRVVDVRGKVLPPGSKPRYLAKRSDYETAHVPGAAFVDWTVDIVDLADAVPMQIAPPDAFASAMTALGIGDDDRDRYRLDDELQLFRVLHTCSGACTSTGAPGNPSYERSFQRPSAAAAIMGL